MRKQTEVIKRAEDHILVRSAGKLYVLRYNWCTRKKQEIEKEYGLNL